MLVRCPQSRTQIRLTEFHRDQRVVPYLCQGCGGRVRLDLILDEIEDSTTETSFRRLRNSWTVLVADDSETTREVAASILREAGYKVLLASDGRSALKDIQLHHPDLVLLSMTLRGVTGFDVLRQMQGQERLQSIPVMIISSVYKPEVVKFLSEHGAAGFMERDRLVESLTFRVQTLLSEQLPIPSSPDF